MPLAKLAIKLNSSHPNRTTRLANPVIKQRLAILTASITRIMTISHTTTKPASRHLLRPHSRFEDIIKSRIRSSPRAIIIYLNSRHLNLYRNTVNKICITLISSIMTNINRQQQMPKISPGNVRTRVARVSRPTTRANSIPSPIAIPINRTTRMRLMSSHQTPPLTHLKERHSTIQQLSTHRILPQLQVRRISPTKVRPRHNAILRPTRQIRHGSRLHTNLFTIRFYLRFNRHHNSILKNIMKRRNMLLITRPFNSIRKRVRHRPLISLIQISRTNLLRATQPSPHSRRHPITSHHQPLVARQRQHRQRLRLIALRQH